MIDFIWEGIDSRDVQLEAICKWIDSTIESNNKISGDICFIFSNDEYILDINNKYLKHDYYTDIITFDYCNDAIISGDIFISIDRVEDNSKQFGVSFDYELLRIIIHGVLHLLGFNDKDVESKKIMTSKEDEYLKMFEDAEGI